MLNDRSEKWRRRVVRDGMDEIKFHDEREVTRANSYYHRIRGISHKFFFILLHAYAAALGIWLYEKWRSVPGFHRNHLARTSAARSPRNSGAFTPQSDSHDG